MPTRSVAFGVLLFSFLSVSIIQGYSFFGSSNKHPEIRQTQPMFLNSASHNGETTHSHGSSDGQADGSDAHSAGIEHAQRNLKFNPNTEKWFSFTLKEPLFDKISRHEAQHYREPGWTIEDSTNSEVDVFIDIPIQMRRQIPGTYDITYKAYYRASSDSDEQPFEGTNEPIAVKTRQVQIYDVNECETGDHDCSQNANCIHMDVGGFYCECKLGYRGTGRVCNDVDECAEHIAVCDLHSACINTPGSYVCECNAGFKKAENDVVCEDIDECETGDHDCSVNAQCLNLPGTFNCKCKEGFEGNGKICTPVNKCRSGEINCHPYADCLVHKDTGEYMCGCKPGFSGDGVTSCEDINECEQDFYTCPVHTHCRNTFGGYQCICDVGFQEIDGHCEDINECTSGSHNCPYHADCYNTIGGYTCECQDGFVKNLEGRCEDSFGVPELTLKGPNPMTISLFDTYSEPGFELEEEREELSLVVRIPPRLHGTARYCGQYEIQYHAKDFSTGKETVLTRQVIVEEINQCKLPLSSPFSHNCHEFAQCVFLPGRCDYDCQCPPGYGGAGFGPTGCQDTVPPVIFYDGPEPFIREVCIVCGTVIATPDLKEPIITRAYDNTPYGQKDISDRLVLTTEPSTIDGCIVHHYSVADGSGNVATKRLTVCLRVEDMRTTIMEMKAMYTWQMWLIRNVAFLCVLAFILFCVWEFGHYIASCFRVLQNANPSHDDKDTAYSLWYRITNPLASRAAVREYVNKKVLLPYDEVGFDSSDDENEEDSEE